MGHIFKITLLTRLFAGLLVAVLAQTLSSGMIWAQDAPAITAPDVDAIARQLAEIEADDALASDIKARATEALQAAHDRLQEAETRKSRLQHYIQQSSNSANILAQLEKEIADIEAGDDNFTLPETREEIRSQLSFVRTDRNLLAKERARLVALGNELSGRASSIATEIADARSSLARFTELAMQEASDSDSPLKRAIRTLRAAQIYERSNAISDLESELETIPQRERIAQSQIALLDAKLAKLDKQIEAIQKRLSDTRTDQADTALQLSLQTQADLQTASPAVRQLAEENVALARQLQQMAADALIIEQDIVLHQDLKEQITRQVETVERVIETGRITDEVGVLLRQVRTSLPKLQTLRDKLLRIEERRIATQLNLILWQDRLRSLTSSDQPERLLFDQLAANTGAPIRIGAQDLTAARKLAGDRARLLKDLIQAGQAQSDRLATQDISLKDTLDVTQDLLNTLDRRLLWLPSTAHPVRAWTSNLLSSLRWLGAPQTLQTSADQMKQAAMNSPIIGLFIFLLAAGFALQKGSMKQSISDLSERVGKVARDMYWTTPAALFLCALIALPLPLLLGGTGTLALVSGVSDPLSKALSSGLIALAIFIFITQFFTAMRAPDSVLPAHFGWNKKATTLLKKQMQWFTPLVSTATFILIGTLASDRSDLQHGIGTIAFLIGSLAIAVFGYHVFKSNNGLAALILSRPPPLFITILGLTGFSLAPLIIGLLPLLGYFDTAIALQSRILLSVAAMIAFPIFYGVLRRLFLVAQRRLALRRALERRAQREAERAELGEDRNLGEEESAPTTSTPEELANERQRISTQTRRILLYLTGLGMLLALSTIWAPMLPALGIASEIVLWTGAGKIGGVESVRPVTLWNLILFFGFIIAGLVAASNIRGLLEIALFQRLKLTQGTRYAVNTIIRYILVSTGLVLGFLQLGIDWGKLQWIIAALGVGLGFGLQEIVANFISGLIILFERPIRVGDTVSIGELEGTVSNIAIRATTITDFDNREVLLPNKAVITENVINWTLRDSVMRITVPIGVAYGTDIEQTHSLLLEIAKANEDVLASPGPRVFFMNHGDSSLDFEVRVYISNPHKRFRVRHELNCAINAALQAAGIEIPFPQRDVHVYQADG